MSVSDISTSHPGAGIINIQHIEWLNPYDGNVCFNKSNTMELGVAVINSTIFDGNLLVNILNMVA